MDPVVNVGGEAQIFSGAGRRRWSLEQCFGDQIAPRVVGVGIAPELFVAAQNIHRAVRSGILGGDDPVQRIISKSLVAGVVFVIGDAKDVAVICA